MPPTKKATAAIDLAVVSASRVIRLDGDHQLGLSGVEVESEDPSRMR